MWAVLDLEADHYVHQRGNKPNPVGVSALARKFGMDTGTI